MNTLLIALLLAPLAQQPAASEPSGDPAKGNAPYVFHLCERCHGRNGEGAFGPDLAGGRGLTFEQFKRAVRQPWGVMLSYTERQLPDQNIAHIYAFMKSKPPVTTTGPWDWRKAPPTAPLGQQLYIQVTGCGQCHEPENKSGRRWLGEVAKDVNYEYFARQIYEHTEKYPAGRMGNYSRDRLPEVVLREIYRWTVDDLGLRASMAGAIASTAVKPDRATFDIAVTNRGVKGKGLGAEGVTVFVRVPPGTKVTAGSGPGYAGVMPLAKLGLEPGLASAPRARDDSGVVERPKPDLSGDVVVWKISKVEPQAKLSLGFTLEGKMTDETLKGFDGSSVYWENPGRRPAGSPPAMIYRDLRSPDKGDQERLDVPQSLQPAPARQ